MNAGMIAFVCSKKAAIFSTYVSKMMVVMDVALSTPDDIAHSCDWSTSCRSVRRISPTSSALAETFANVPSSLALRRDISCDKSGSSVCITRASGCSCSWRFETKCVKNLRYCCAVCVQGLRVRRHCDFRSVLRCVSQTLP